MTDTDSKTPTVLIVEDEQSLADVYAVWLSESYSVKTTYSGEQALDAVDESIDVVLLDRRMPRVSGDEVLEHIRRDGYDVRVVIVSAITPDVDVLDMRFDEYLVKPVDSEEVVDVVERMVARSRVDDTTRELAQLLTKKATIERALSRSKLQSHDEYQRLQRRVEALQSETEELHEAFREGDVRDMFRDLGGAHD